MMIIRTKRISHFTTIPNELINDSRLAWKELGLLVYLLSKPDTWSVRVDALVKDRKIGRDAVYVMLKRLREVGYASLIKHSNGSTEWTIFDKPNTENPDLDNPDKAYPNPENPDQENPDLDNPHVLVNTDIKKRLSNSNKENIKRKKSDPVREELSEVTDQTFADFIELRKAKKAPLTIRAIQSIKTEADKAGVSLETALIECCARGWQSFKAEWYTKTQTPLTRASPIIPIDRTEYLKKQNEIVRDKLFGIQPMEKDITHG